MLANRMLIAIREHRATAQTSGSALRKACNAASARSGCGNLNGARMISAEDRVHVLDDRTEQTLNGVRQLILEVVLRVERNVLLEHPQRVLRLLVRFGALLCLHDHIRNTIARARRSARITLPHLLCQHQVRLIRLLVVLCLLAQRLADHQQREIQSIAEQVGYEILCVLHSAIHISLDQNLL